MTKAALQMERVYKAFRKGETYSSLRDFVPALTGRMFRRQDINSHNGREFWALRDISFEVHPGEAFGIIGHNGAGKSTMLKILSRIMKPTRGSMMVRGRLSALIEVTAGFHQDLTGRENIFLHGTILGMKQTEIAEKFDQIVAFSGLEEFIDTPVKRYSSGMYARLGFAVAAHVNPDILLVDEVLSVGDYAFQQRCVEKMKSIIRDGVTVLFVSHNLKTVAEFCERCMLLECGKITTLGNCNDVITGYIHGQRSRRNLDESREVAITKVTVRGESGERVNFSSGDKAWVDIEVLARKACSKLSLSLHISDSLDYLVFNTSMERLGYPNFDLRAGQVFRCTFELDLNLAIGTFNISTLIYRYDTQTEYDRWPHAATIFVSSPQDVRGAVHCFPRIIHREIYDAPSTVVLAESPGDRG
jgi:lipopolysaccharide transport system ATP-binding protein